MVTGHHLLWVSCGHRPPRWNQDGKRGTPAPHAPASPCDPHPLVRTPILEYHLKGLNVERMWCEGIAADLASGVGDVGDVTG